MPDLDFGIKYFEEKLGVAPIFGGYHKTQGTKNALINLSDECYLEVIAVDPENDEIQPNRWMGIDHLQAPKLIRWAIKSSDLEKDQRILREYDEAMGDILPGSRQVASGELLKWELIMPLSAPEVEVIPFVLDWSKSEFHPTSKLMPSGFTLTKIRLVHPDPEKIKKVLERLEVEAEVTLGKSTSINAVLEGPNGAKLVI